MTKKNHLSKTHRKLNLDSLGILLLGKDDFPDQDIDENFIRLLFKHFPERYNDLIPEDEPMKGVVEVFYSDSENAYQIWHEIITEHPEDLYRGVDVMQEEIDKIRAELKK